MGASIGLTGYQTIVREDFTVFVDPNEVPDPADFVAYVVTQVAPYFQQ